MTLYGKDLEIYERNLKINELLNLNVKLQIRILELEEKLSSHGIEFLREIPE